MSPLSAMFAAVLVAIPACPLSAQGVDARFEAAFETHFDDGFAGVCVVARDGKVVLERAFGKDERGRKMDGNTPFDIGPVAELLTAVTVLELTRRGQLSLEDSVADHLPGAPDSFRRLSVDELMAHVSSLPDLYASGDAARDREAFVAEVFEAKFVAPPGRHHEHRAVDYAMTAAIVEAVTGETFEDMVADLVLRPARMKQTRFVDGLDWRRRGHGGVVSTPRDLVRLCDAIDRGMLLDEERRDRLLRPLAFTGESFGVTIRQGPGGVSTLHRDGDGRQTAASLTWHVDQDTVIVIAGTPGYEFGALDLELEDALVEAGEIGSDWSPLVGTYRVGSREELIVAESHGSLVLRSVGMQLSSRLSHGRPENPEWPAFYRDVEARGAVLLKPLLRQDAASFGRGFHDAAPANAAATAMAMVARFIEESGDVGDPELIGARALNGTQSWYRVGFGKTNVTLRLDWHGEQLNWVGESDQEYPFEVHLTPIGESRFRGRSLDGASSILVEFQRSGERPARSLVFKDESKSGKRGIRARRTR